MLEKLPVGIGEALQKQRAGLEQTVLWRAARAGAMAVIRVRSPVFSEGGEIPLKYTADGGGLSPPLAWQGIPEGATSIVVVVEDADSPTPHPLVHAIVVNIDPLKSSLPEGALDSPHHQGLGLNVGRNSYLSRGWLPPDPPPGHGVHRYHFQVFALQGPPLPEVPGRGEVVEAINAHGIAAGGIIGTYERLEKAKIGELLSEVRVPLEPAANVSEVKHHGS